MFPFGYYWISQRFFRKNKILIPKDKDGFFFIYVNPKTDWKCFESCGWQRPKMQTSKRETKLRRVCPRGGDSHMKQKGMLVGNFEFNP